MAHSTDSHSKPVRLFLAIAAPLTLLPFTSPLALSSPSIFTGGLTDTRPALAPDRSSSAKGAIAIPQTAPNSTTNSATSSTTNSTTNSSWINNPRNAWWLLPLLGIPLLAWLLFRRRSERQTVLPHTDSTLESMEAGPRSLDTPHRESLTAAAILPAPENLENLAIAPTSNHSGLATGLAAGAAGVAALSHLRKATPEQSRMILVPRDAHHAYAYWELSPADQAMVQAPGQTLALRLHETDDTGAMKESYRQYTCDRDLRDRHLAVPQSNRHYLAELGYLSSVQIWHGITRSAAVRVPALDAEMGSAQTLANTLDQTWISLTPLNSHQADVEWNISSRHRQLMQAQGAQQLVLKLHDADHLDLDEQPAHATQDYVCDDLIHRRLVELPQGDRDYVAEIGYRTANGRWLRVARSIHSHVPTSDYDGCRIVILSCDSYHRIHEIGKQHPQAYVYWDIAPDRKQTLRQQGGQMLVLRIYDADHIDLDQQPAHHTSEFVVDEQARDLVVPVERGDRDYVAELGYLTLEGQFLSLGRSLHAHIPTLKSMQKEN